MQWAYYRAMQAQFEKLYPGRGAFLAFERRDPEFPFHWHFHPEFELTLILESCGQRLVGDSVVEYGPGDLVLLGPSVPHTWRSRPANSTMRKLHRAVVVQFRENFLGEGFFALDDLRPVARLLRRSMSGLAFGHTRTGREAAHALAELPGLAPTRRLISLLHILTDLAGDSHATALSTTRILPMCRVQDQQRIDKVCTYLNQHVDQKIELAEISRLVHMDPASLCRFFKRATGRTMTSYVNELRIGSATRLLMETDASILDIGFRVGFGNYSNFSRQFKRIKGYGPRDLRRRFAAPEDSVEISQPGGRRAGRQALA